MLRSLATRPKTNRRRWLLLPVAVCALISTGCSIFSQREVQPLPGNGGANRRTQLWRLTRRQSSRHPTATRPATTMPAATRSAATHPTATRPTDERTTATRPVLPPFVPPSIATTRPASTQPEDALEPIAEPYEINNNNVIRIMYLKSPLVVASREEMIAARYGLEEFRANLSRIEPYIRVDGSTSDFPERRGRTGQEGELVAGIDSETFDGAVLRVEGGVSGSQYHFERTEDDPAETESSRGGVLRARIEIPFVGSRKRQARTIDQAYQESTARAAMLEYLTNFRTYLTSALADYRLTLLYLNEMRSYEGQIAALEALLALPGLTDIDRMRLQTAVGDAKVTHNQFQAYYWTSLLTLLQELGIQPGEKYVLKEMTELPLRYLQQVQSPEGQRELLTRAYENNPRFAVLQDAIRNAELKRSQAILGSYDITASLEGTHFPFGGREFDDRFRGWLLTAGITVRLNDRRVLTASLKKAEAEIRAFRAQIQAEENDIRDQVTVRADRLRSYYQSRPQIIENISRARAQFEERCEAYFFRKVAKMTIDDVLTPLYLLTDAEVQLATNLNQIADAENDIIVATGEVYRLVGIRLVDRGKGMELTETVTTQPAEPSSQPAQ